MKFHIEYCKDTYEPSDDSFLLEKIIYSDLYREILLIKRTGKHTAPIKSIHIADVGSGTGYLTIALCSLIAHKHLDIGINIYSIDIDSNAVECTKRNTKYCEIDGAIHVIQCNSTSCIRNDIIDIALVNPPYLPDSGDARIDHYRWSGGPHGIEAPIEIIKHIYRSLRSRGIIYVVLSSLSSIERFHSEYKNLFKIELIDRKKLFFEELYVYKMNALK